MNVNENRLRELLDNIFNTTCPCEVCPLNKCSFEKSCIDDCEEAIMQYLQGFDVAEALEAGAHIVNDKVIFPPEEIPYEPCYEVPCEKLGKYYGQSGFYCYECEYNLSCPY